MKAISILVVLSSVLMGVNADKHGACACQINTDGALDDSSTQTCCTRYGGKISFLTTSGKVRFAGDYCLKTDIDGDSWYNCCRQFVDGGDSACPW
ncbi:hypothetical protein F5X96DRAFT_675586 [Biscogniauxia mediterranea]|nr:hypothetical protein F5X96DRAFT_675586 [Biscogniauxia mediterranea]